jgi:phage I-like protein
MQLLIQLKNKGSVDDPDVVKDPDGEAQILPEGKSRQADFTSNTDLLPTWFQTNKSSR